jgi:hypothetical protein
LLKAEPGEVGGFGERKNGERPAEAAVIEIGEPAPRVCESDTDMVAGSSSPPPPPPPPVVAYAAALSCGALRAATDAGTRHRATIVFLPVRLHDLV